MTMGYGMLFGESSASHVLLDMLGLKREDVYRYRNCYLIVERPGQIAVYTRGGGGNRECYDDGDTCRKSEGVHGPKCVVSVQARLREHPCYVWDIDDDFDCTYATFYFRLPDELRGRLEGVESEQDRNAVWVSFLDGLRQAVVSP